jgi:hypothetical protein
MPTNRNQQYRAANPYTDNLHSDKEHEYLLRHLKVALNNESCREVFKYFVKHFGVGELPPVMTGNNELRMDIIGFNRAGQAIWELISQADPVQAGLILAQVTKEKYNVQEIINGQS